MLAGSFFTPQDPQFQTGVYPLHVPSYTTIDLNLRYAVTPKLTLTGGILNLTDELPPYDPGFSATDLYDFSQYDVRGIQYRVGFQYKLYSGRGCPNPNGPFGARFSLTERIGMATNV